MNIENDRNKSNVDSRARRKCINLDAIVVDRMDIRQTNLHRFLVMLNAHIFAYTLSKSESVKFSQI